MRYFRSFLRSSSLISLLCFVAAFPPLGTTSVFKILALPAFISIRLSKPTAAVHVFFIVSLPFLIPRIPIDIKFIAIEAISFYLVAICLSTALSLRRHINLLLAYSNNCRLVAVILSLSLFFYAFISCALGNVYFYDDYGSSRLFAGMGAATFSIYLTLIISLILNYLALSGFHLSAFSRSSWTLYLFFLFVLNGLTGSRASFFVSILIFLLAIVKSGKYSFISFFFFLLFLSPAIYRVLGRSGLTSESGFSILLSDTFSGRTILWPQILSFFQPLGNGYGSGIQFAVEAGRFIGYVEDQPHSEIIRTLMVYGFAGVLIILIIASILFMLLRSPFLFLPLVALGLIAFTDNILVYWHFLFISISPILFSMRSEASFARN